MNIRTYPLPDDADILLKAARVHLDDYMAHLVDHWSEQRRVLQCIRALRHLEYPIDLSGVHLIADTACHLDGYRSLLVDGEAERVRLLVERLHTMAMNAAGDELGQVYAEGE